MRNDSNRFGHLLVEMRVAVGFTQNDLARAAGYGGGGRVNIAQYERGAWLPPRDIFVLLRLADALGHLPASAQAIHLVEAATLDIADAYDSLYRGHRLKR